MKQILRRKPPLVDRVLLMIQKLVHRKSKKEILYDKVKKYNKE